MNSDSAQAPWHTNLFLVVGVALTVVMALLMSQLDRLQTRLVPTVPVVAQVTEVVATPTPLSAIALATALPPSPTVIFGEENGDEVTAVPSAACGLPPAGWVAYIVQSGDTLFILSRHSGASIEEIIQVNCLDGYLVTGTQIYLPKALPSRSCGPPTWWVRYTVQAGDTMFALARSRGTSVAEVMNANCLTSTRLYAGRNIYLPGVATAVPTATPAPPPTRKPQPTHTPVPTNTAPPPPSPTMTPTETSTAVTAMPTNTATATFTPTIVSTVTLFPTATLTATVTATPSDTPVPTPTSSAMPVHTATPLPPTSTPTATPVPSNTPDPYPPLPTDTPIPETVTPYP